MKDRTVLPSNGCSWTFDEPVVPGVVKGFQDFSVAQFFIPVSAQLMVGSLRLQPA